MTVTENSWKIPRSRLSVFRSEKHREFAETAMPIIFDDYWENIKVIAHAENRISNFFGFPFVTATNSGSTALLIALQALGVGQGDEVIVPCNTDMANTNVIANCGATSILCDVLLTDYTIDIQKASNLITEKTKAIMAVDIFGHPADVRGLKELTSVPILEDAALATFSRDYGKPVGSFSDVVVFSTSATKLIHGAVFGGFVLTNNHLLGRRSQLLVGYGIDNEKTKASFSHDLRFHSENGNNVRMHPLDAAMVIKEIPYYEMFQENRAKVVGWYEKYFTGISGVILPVIRTSANAIVREYVVRITGNKNRNEVYNHLMAERIQCSLNYTPSFHKREISCRGNYAIRDSLSTAEQLDNEIIGLPVDPLMSEYDVEKIARIIDKF